MKQCTWIPIISEPKGALLTAQNLNQIGVNIASCHIEHLMMKPGLEALLKIGTLSDYFGQIPAISLNGSGLRFDVEDSVTIRSEYDGSKLSITREQWHQLIRQIKPQLVLLPKGTSLETLAQLQKDLPNTQFFVPISEHSKDFPEFKAYFIWQPMQKSFEALQKELENNLDVGFILGDFTLTQFQSISVYFSGYIESNHPFQDAMNGIVYTETSAININEAIHTHSHLLIDEHCECSTCRAHLTRAYFHHLQAHTPLLSYRFLAMHNGYKFIRG